MSEPFDTSACRVALLAGGRSGERAISLASCEGAKEALEEAGFPVTVLDPASRQDLIKLIEGSFDVAFLCVHGKYGEDGTLQGLLEIIGLPYIGSGVWSSSLAIDKAKAKVFYERDGIPTPPSVTLYKSEDYSQLEIIKDLGERCVVKPATEGSSLGLYIVEGEQDIKEAIDQVFSIDNEAVVERFVQGREFTVAVIGNDDLQALPVIEIVPTNEFYDFESKYAPGRSKHICPAELDERQTQRVQELAMAAHRALGCAGLSRSDFILDEDGVFWILETNTIPGMTGTSLLPDAARAAGISFSELCTRLVRYALEK